MMTTTTATQLRRSRPRRMRRNVSAMLVGGALIASSALVVNRIIDNDPNRVTAQSTVATRPSLDPAVDPPRMRLVINEPTHEACALGFAEACPSAHEWVSDGSPLVLDRFALDACNGGYVEACTPAVAE